IATSGYLVYFSMKMKCDFHLEIIAIGIESSICITIINELDLVFSNKFGLPRPHVREILDLILSITIVETEPDHLNSLKDHDQRILVTADLNSCSHLITGDKYLLERISFNGTNIISTKEALSILERIQTKI
ncbi:MAG: hypothetical protein U9R75_08950, partial [Candidatus Thermoplasmatota archaeon]|nr:hypothetical protein [Candidatus Thermoplasmatota archaeon]